MQRAARFTLIAVEIASITLLTLTARCALYPDIFCGGHINFVDADCYSRMTRARICFEHPGTIVRRHDFENFPSGTSPHATSPFDYLVVALAAALAPLSTNAFELAGAIVSPLLAVGLGIFLCWWSRKMRLPFRWALLILYAVSPILAHGFALGRPDHQSLVVALTTIALCAEWTLAREQSRFWGIVAGACWALALWVSLYEPLILLISVCAFRAAEMMKTERRIGWIVFFAIIALAFALERRVPAWPSREFAGALKNWSATVGELTHVSLTSGIWFDWCGWLLLLAPVLLWPKRKCNSPFVFMPLLIATFALTIWQARWSYFFVMIFAMVVPEILSVLRKPVVATTIFIVALFPIMQSWDRVFADEELARRADNRIEQLELRAIASQVDGAFIAPWWFSPALSYWSGQAGIAGSSHESIKGIVETAKFFGTVKTEEAAQVSREVMARWIVAYDGDRVARSSAQVLGRSVSNGALCYLLDRRPSQAPPFLRLVRQTAHFKIFQTLNP